MIEPSGRTQMAPCAEKETILLKELQPLVLFVIDDKNTTWVVGDLFGIVEVIDSLEKRPRPFSIDFRNVPSLMKN